MDIIITASGKGRCIYGESIDLTSLGQLEIMRGSHVEPDLAGRWWADLSPVDGPRLGPFDHRSDALASELEWLEQYWLQALPVSATVSDDVG